MSTIIKIIVGALIALIAWFISKAHAKKKMLAAAERDQRQCEIL